MSEALERAFGELLHGFFIQKSKFSLHHISLALLNFTEKLSVMQHTSDEIEKNFIKSESNKWKQIINQPGVTSETVADILCQALIASVGGHTFSDLCMQAIRLTQEKNVTYKRIGYIFLSQSMQPDSDFSLLLVNSLYRDISSSNVLIAYLGLSMAFITVDHTLSVPFHSTLSRMLSSKQANLRRRAVHVLGTTVKYYSNEVALFIPKLVYLLSDSDPSTAASACFTLSILYKVIAIKNDKIRNEIAGCCAHIMHQALHGLMSAAYNIQDVRAPFLIIQMLKSVHNVADQTWVAPPKVVSVIEEIFELRHVSEAYAVYAVLYEAVVTVYSLASCELLKTASYHTLLRFLKSMDINIKYMGIKALELLVVDNDFLEEDINKDYVKQLLDCLYHSNSVLQNKSIHIICSLANYRNYQAVFQTIFDFLKISQCQETRRKLYFDLLSITKKFCFDIIWCLNSLEPLLFTDVCDSSVYDTLKSCFHKSLKQENLSSEVVEVSIKTVLNILCCKEAKNSVHFLISALILLVIMKHSFFEIPENVAKNFVSKLESIDVIDDREETVYECLTNIGLLYPHLSTLVISLLEKPQINIYNKLSLKYYTKLLHKSEIAINVMQRQKQILAGNEKPDFSLSFLDDYIAKKIEEDELSLTLSETSVQLNLALKDGLGGSLLTITSLDSSDNQSLSSTSPYATITTESQSVFSKLSEKPSIWSSSGRLRFHQEEEKETFSESQFIEVAEEATEEPSRSTKHSTLLAAIFNN